MMVITVEIPTGQHPMRREIHVRNVLGPAGTLMLPPGSSEDDRLYEIRTELDGRVGYVVHDRRQGAEQLAAAALEHVATHAPREIPL